MPGIFVSYRRDDTAGQAGRLAEQLEARYGRSRVFIDIDAIAPGDDFEDRIHETLSSASVALVLIGEKWLEPRAGGGRRIDEAGDYVRQEIAAALARTDNTVIPVLIERSDMPGPTELPPEIAGLARRNAFKLSNERWRYDVERLCERIDQVTSTSVLDRGWQRARRRAGLVGVGLAILVAAIAAVIIAGSGSGASAAVRIDDIPIANPPASYQQRGTIGPDVQVTRSKPTIELKIHNLATQAADVTAARITVADVLRVQPCFSAGGTNLSATYQTVLPLTKGASIDKVINEQVKPDGFDFFQIVFDLPLSAYGPGGLDDWFFRLHIQLLHDAQPTPVDAGYVLLAFSGAPDPAGYSYWWTKQVAVKPGYAKLVQTWGKANIDCAIAHTPTIERFLAQPGRRSPELASFASQLTTKF